MSITVEHPHGDALTLVTLTGEHDLATAVTVRRVLIDLAVRRLVVVDLAPCQFLDSSILGVLAGAAKRISSTGGHLVVINARGIVAKALQIIGLDALLAPASVLDAASDQALVQQLQND